MATSGRGYIHRRLRYTERLHCAQCLVEWSQREWPGTFDVSSAETVMGGDALCEKHMRERLIQRAPQVRGLTPLQTIIDEVAPGWIRAVAEVPSGSD